MTAAVLETQNLSKAFGGLVATNDVSFKLPAGARHALIGPNGAGKTTLVNLLTGVLQPTSGRILLKGEDITSLPSHQRVKRGLARTFQINQLFAELTPLQHIVLAISEREGAATGWWRPVGSRSDIVDEAEALLRQLTLTDVRDQRTETIAYGKQRLLEIAVALAARPAVLLLDEPAAGVPETERHQILDVIAALPDSVTLLLIEHDMQLVFRFAKTISVLVNGGLFMEGPAAEIARDERVKKVYLGEEVVNV
ncbi:ABC transporter ATP-binding protein [Ferrovibrio terrae]|uniref:ABC transporter ATP-binding protein n=1 Tax=Ferrovibrio terrae TaxID=2594003 RepID=A0A516H2M3_9PROT|nr:ABC transporter ATP-binding protein [Ferrovibrio terrae]QDO98032.1 ABC transporter ATP-binding protein [Ferrovibrio terrae]